MEKEKRLLKGLKWSFGVSIIFSFLLIAVAFLNLPGEIIAGTGLIASISGLMFYYYLARITILLKKSPIIWVGLAFLTPPVGPIIAYLKIQSLSIEKGWY